MESYYVAKVNRPETETETITQLTKSIKGVYAFCIANQLKAKNKDELVEFAAINDSFKADKVEIDSSLTSCLIGFISEE